MTARTDCWVCGRRARRHCPAADKAICPACCGSKRGIEIKCPSDCEFYPFGVAGYDLWLRLDDAVLPKLVSRVVEEFGQHHVQNLFDSLAAVGMGKFRNEDFALCSSLQICLSVERDKDGATLADRWEAQGWAGLKPDEALMMCYRSKSFVTVIEVQRVLDHQRVECIDLFRVPPEPFVILDRSLARSVVRFSRIFGWVTHYPNFSKTGPSAFIVPQIIRWEFMDLIGDLAQPAKKERARDGGSSDGGLDARGAVGEQPDSVGVHVDLIGGRPDVVREHPGSGSEQPDEAALRQAMLGNLPGLIQALLELPGEKTLSILRGMDVFHCTGFYRLNAPTEDVIRVLEAKPDFERVDEEPAEGVPARTAYYDWHRLGESQEFEKEMPGVFRHGPDSGIVGGLGNLRVGRDEMVFETFAKAKYEFGKKMLVKYFGGMVTLEKETAVDLARKVADRQREGHGRDRGLDSECADDADYLEHSRHTEHSGHAGRGEFSGHADRRDRRDRATPARTGSIPLALRAEAARRFHTDYYTKFLDDAVPALGGLSPRQAAKDPAARPLLVDLMKEHICGIEGDNREQGLDLDLGFVLKELGLDELL